MGNSEEERNIWKDPIIKAGWGIGQKMKVGAARDKETKHIQ